MSFRVLDNRVWSKTKVRRICRSAEINDPTEEMVLARDMAWGSGPAENPKETLLPASGSLG